jgi:hypothetical protein
MSDNGQPDAQRVQELEAGPRDAGGGAPSPPRPRAGRNADDLTPRDLLRARTMLAEAGDPRSPYDLMEDDIEKSALVIWCLKSRTDAQFTYEQALDTPYSEFTVEDDEPPPPPGGPPGSPGPEAAMSRAAASRKRRPAGATAPS